MLPLRVIADLRAIVMKEYSKFPKFQRLEPRHQIFCHIQDTRFEVEFNLSAKIELLYSTSTIDWAVVSLILPSFSVHSKHLSPRTSLTERKKNKNKKTEIQKTLHLHFRIGWIACCVGLSSLYIYIYIYIYIYEVSSISFQTFLYRHLKLL